MMFLLRELQVPHPRLEVRLDAGGEIQPTAEVGTR